MRYFLRLLLRHANITAKNSTYIFGLQKKCKKKRKILLAPYWREEREEREKREEFKGELQTMSVLHAMSKIGSPLSDCKNEEEKLSYEVSDFW